MLKYHHQNLKSTFENGKYTELVFMISLNVGVRIISSIIFDSYKIILISFYLLESLTIVQAQLGDDLSHSD